MLKVDQKFTPNILLVAITISGISTFMIYPLLVFRLLDVGVNLGAIGLILGALSGTGRVCSFLIGSINSKFGSKPTVCLGITLRIIGISIFAFESQLYLYIVFSALASIGSSASALGIKTELLRQSAERKLITLRSMAINSGAILGPALGAALYHVFSFHTILYLSIATYGLMVLFLTLTSFSPPESTSLTNGSGGIRSGKYSRYVAITLIASSYWAIYSQWAIIVPLISTQSFGYEESSNLVYMANAVIVLVLQYPLVVVALKSVKDSTVLLLGFSVFLVAFIMLFIPSSFLMVALFCLGFSIAELLVSPSLDSQTAKVAPASLGLTRAYGIQDTITGIFSIAGSSIGGLVLQSVESPSATAILCMPLAIIAIFLSATILHFGQRR
ncbi:MFS transporter [Corynebacterium belfantii]|uniref:MFS transporter n=1 Tax=Corynebacterium belfantii TaxID=2014537 RepID=UPI0018D2920F|nr:MFS transporter [Corynebacterium belfantii]